MSSVSHRLISYEEYCALEEQAEVKSEFYQGEMFAMSGGTGVHSLLSTNAIFQLSLQLGGSGCRVHSGDMRIYIEATGLNTYADAVVVCGPDQYRDSRKTSLLNPKLIVEVLSPGTEAYDRGRKRSHYIQIPSLQHYLLISQKETNAELHTRGADGAWVVTQALRPGESVTLSALNCTLSIEELYRETEVPTPRLREAIPDELA